MAKGGGAKEIFIFSKYFFEKTCTFSSFIPNFVGGGVFDNPVLHFALLTFITIMPMRKLFLTLLLLAGSWCSSQAASWAVTDTTVADGYYYICNNFVSDGVAGKGVVCTGDAAAGGDATFKGYKALFVKPYQQLSSDFRTDINAVFRVWRTEDGAYHIKSMDDGNANYFYPQTIRGGYSTYLIGTGKERCTYQFRTMDYGSPTSTSDAATATRSMTRKDTPQNPTSAQIEAGLKIGEDTANLVPASKTFFILPSVTAWRWRLGGNQLVKINSYHLGAGASWYLEPVKLTEDDETWLEARFAFSEALGENFVLGNNPGEVYSQTALNSFEDALNKMDDLLSNGATAEEYAKATAALEEAKKETQKYIVPINGYYYIRNSYDNGKGVRSFAASFNDLQPRNTLPSSYDMDDKYPDDNQRRKINSHTFLPHGRYFGYLRLTNADMDGTTAENSGIADKFIWKITPQEDGSYAMKNCGERAEIGDSSYVMTVVKRVTDGANAWCQMPMVGTPHQGTLFENVQENKYAISFTDNYFQLNLGVQHFTTMNTCNTMTVALWELFTVPEARITSKFKLNAAITDAGGVFTDWAVGDWPGMVKESYVADLRAELAKAQALYDAGGDDATLDAQTAALEKVYKETMAVLKDTDKVLNPIEEGYYHFVNTDTFNLEWAEKYKWISGISTSYGAKQSFWIPRDGNEYFGCSGTVKGWKAQYHMYANKDNALMWKYQEKYLANSETQELEPNKDYVSHDLFNTWEFKKAGKNSYGRQLWYIRNLGTNYYLDMSSDGARSLSEEPQAIALDDNVQALFPNGTYYYRMNLVRGRGAFMVTSSEYERYMNPLDNAGQGSNTPGNKSNTDALGLNGKTGYITARLNTAGNYYGAYWAFEPVTGKVLDSLLAIGNAEARVIEMHGVIGDAEKALANTVNYTLGDSLITDAGVVGEGDDATYDPAKTQIWLVHNQWGEGSYKDLIDGDLSTYVHSRWSEAGGPLKEVNDYPAVIVNLKTPKSKIVFKHGMRGNKNILYGPLGNAPITYGTTDHGFNYSPVDIIVYGGNDSIGPWKEVSYIKDIAALKNRRIYTSPLIESSEAYQYYKFSVTKNVSGKGTAGFPYIAPSYFQVFDAEKDAANSPVEYNAAIKQPAENLAKLLAEAKAAYTAKDVSPELLVNTRKAVEELNKVAPDTTTLFARILDAEVLRDSSYVEDALPNQQYGDVTSDQKATFEAAIASARTAILPASHPTQESLKTAYEALDKAYLQMNSEKKTFELDKWYYIVSTEYQGYHCRWNWAWRGNQMVYACGDIPQEKLIEHKMAYPASHVRWGHYTDFKGMPEGQTYPKSLGENVDYTGGKFDTEANPYTMWRIVKVTDSTYAIQNRANGLYLGRRQDLTTGSNNYVTLSKEPMPMEINLLGRDQYEILPADSTCAYYAQQADKADPGSGKYPTPVYEKGLPLHSQGSDFHLVWWGSGTERGYNTGSAYTFKEVKDPDLDLEIGVKEDNVTIMSLPYPVDFGDPEGGTVATTGKTAHSYSLKNITHPTESTSALELTYKSSFEAGEPFILVTGNPAEAIEGIKDSINLYITPADISQYSLENKTVNGLVATLGGDSIKAAGFGIFEDAILTTTTDKTVHIDGHSGYINPALTTDAGGNADATINGSGILNAIRNIEAVAGKEFVDVYTLDGKLVKSHAKSADAFKGLGKGVYIIGKKKVIIE